MKQKQKVNKLVDEIKITIPVDIAVGLYHAMIVYERIMRPPEGLEHIWAKTPGETAEFVKGKIERAMEREHPEYSKYIPRC